MDTNKENQNWYNLMLQMDLEHARHSTYIPKFERRLLKRRIRQKNTYEYILLVKDLPLQRIKSEIIRYNIFVIHFFIH